MHRLTLAVFALLFTFAAQAHAADSRTEFLKLIDRPRVLPAVTVEPVSEKNGVAEIAFSFSSDAENRVTGLILRPVAAGRNKHPVVISLHGTGGNKESQRAFLTEMVKAGFIGVAIDGRYHGARAKGGSAAKSKEYVDAILRAYRTPGKEYPFFFDTVWDVMRLIDYVEKRDDVDPKRIGLIGFSKGGIETYLAAAADPRIAVAVPCIGVESFRWANENNSWQSRIGTVQAAFDGAAKEAGVAKPDGEFVHQFYARVAPGLDREFDGPAMLPLIAPRPLLSINGEIDPRTPMPGLKLCEEAARTAYRAAGANEKFVLHIQANTGHKVLPESLVLAREWFVKWLRAAP
jgi:dienelactone hydrolase